MYCIAKNHINSEGKICMCHNAAFSCRQYSVFDQYAIILANTGKTPLDLHLSAEGFTRVLLLGVFYSCCLVWLPAGRDRAWSRWIINFGSAAAPSSSGHSLKPQTLLCNFIEPLVTYCLWNYIAAICLANTHTKLWLLVWLLYGSAFVFLQSDPLVLVWLV